MKNTRYVRLVGRILCLAMFVALLVIPGRGQTASAQDGDDVFEALQITKYAERQDVSDFTLPAIDGRETSLSDFTGKVVLLNFWTTW